MALHRFVMRAPRYVLQPGDRQMVRYAPERGLGPSRVHQTRLLNLSETGMAIMVHRYGAPQVGERMMIELPVPGGGQIAWWATVTRVEELDSNWWLKDKDEDHDKVMVGIRFDALPEGHRLAIRKGLESRFIEELRERRRKHFLYFKEFWLAHSLQIFFYVSLILGAFWLLYWLSRPTLNYDAKHGSPWGQRYKIFNFDDDDSTSK